MIKNILSTIVLVAAFAVAANAQFTMIQGNKSLEIGFGLEGYYNHRFYDASKTNLKKNYFQLRNARLKIDSRIGKHWEFDFELDLADLQGVLQSQAGSFFNPTPTPALYNFPSANNVIYGANAKYKSDWGTDFTIGYQKLPFSRNNMVSIFEQAIMHRPSLTDGSTFNRYDMGVTAHHAFWYDKLNVYLGAYNGMGSVIPANDASGNLLYLGRVDVSYPSKFKYKEVDLNQCPIPLVSLGASGMYTEKSTDLISDDKYLYPLSINGKKAQFEIDLAFKYQGFSLQAEVHRSRLTANDTSNVILMGQGKYTNYAQTGGYFVAANYYAKPIKTLFGVRYDEINPNDLILNNMQRSLSFSAVIMPKGSFNACIRAEYFHRFKDDRTQAAWKDDEIRLGFQYLMW